MSYELILTDNSKHISWSLPVGNTDDIIEIFNLYIFPIVNKRLTDDDYASISLTVNKLLYSYKYRGSNEWSERIQPDIATTIIGEQYSLSWHDILTHWKNLLNEIERSENSLYRWEFSNVDNLGFQALETLFGRTMYLSLFTNRVTLVVKSTLSSFGNNI